jgi:phage gp36-like protein
MAYLTRDQIGLYCKNQELPNNLDDTGLNEELILSTIDLMQSEIDSFLRQGGYKLPIESGSQIKILNLTIPVYRYYITLQSGMQTEQISKDYEIALNKLKMIAKGDILLDLKTNDTEESPTKNNSGMFFLSTGRR